MERNKSAWSDTEVLASLINSLNGELVGLEIGTLHGGATIDLLKRVPKIKNLIAIDPFKVYDDITFPPYDKQEYWDELYEDVKKDFTETGRAELVRGLSWEVHEQFQDGGYDFIFIDGDHSYEAIKKDLELYVPKIRAGGLVMGHDHNEHNPGVVKAVKEFSPKNSFSVHQESGIYSWVV